MFMEIAHTVAKRSTCMRLNVGAVLVQGRSIVSIGYNGVPPSAPHCLGNDCPGKHHCHETTHAEINAIRYLPSSLDLRRKLDLYVTDSPCLDCFQAILSGDIIQRIFFAHPYRINDHLIQGELPIYRITPAGYTMDWRTKELVFVET
jgi:dCMP deaminase